MNCLRTGISIVVIATAILLGAVSASALETNALETGAIETNALETGALVSSASDTSTLRLEGRGLDGEIVRLADYRGRYVLVDFWATWCGPCVAEFGNVKKAYDEFRDSGFIVIGVSLDRPGDTEKVRAFLSQRRATWPQIFDGRAWQSPLVRAWGVDEVGIPATFLVDPKGRIVDSELRGNRLRARLRELLSPRGTP